jgi:hypothetical protein
MDLTDEPGSALNTKAIIPRIVLTEILLRCHRSILLIR